MKPRSKSNSMLSGTVASVLLSIVLAACGTPASLRIQQRANGIEAGFVEFPVWRLTPDQPFPSPDSFVGRLSGEGANQEILVRAGSRRTVLSLDCYSSSARHLRCVQRERVSGRQPSQALYPKRKMSIGNKVALPRWNSRAGRTSGRVSSGGRPRSRREVVGWSSTVTTMGIGLELAGAPAPSHEVRRQKEQPISRSLTPLRGTAYLWREPGGRTSLGTARWSGSETITYCSL